MFSTVLDRLKELNGKTGELVQKITRPGARGWVARSLTATPGAGPIVATALAALALRAEPFKKGRDFAARAGR